MKYCVPVCSETGDRVIRGDGKFEELMVCAQEIAASTTQLVVASKVKADQKSEKLSQLSDASKKVTEATGSVVASSKTAAQMIDDIGMVNSDYVATNVAVIVKHIVYKLAVAAL